MPLSIAEMTCRLRWTSPGRLLPWMGPALRGIVAGRMKQQHCRFSPAEQDGRWKYCKGCPHQADCSYGRLFEPDAPPEIAFPGQGDAVRPLVLAPEFPAPAQARPGETINLRMVFIARSHVDAEACLTTIREAGASRSLGPDRIGFDAEPLRLEETQMNLPTEWPSDGKATNRLAIELNSPLILRSAQGGERTQLIREPSFADLFGGCLRTVGRLIALYDRQLPNEVFRMLKQAAAGVRTHRADYRPFRQWHWSNRGRSGGSVNGLTGRAEFTDVPPVLVEWMRWAGRLHVGVYRVSGAGGWRVGV